MAIRTREEIMTDLAAILGDDTSDAAINLVQDISDTLDGSGSGEIETLRQQIEEQDAAWRKRYRDTFFTGKPEKDDEEPERKKPRTFADLFTTN